MGSTYDDGGVWSRPIPFKRTEPIVTRPLMALLSEPLLDRPSIMLTSDLYERCPAAVMSILHRMSQASEVIYHPAIHGYQVLTRRLMPEDFEVFMAWYKAEQAKLTDPTDEELAARGLKSGTVESDVRYKFTPAPPLPRAKLSSDPPPPKIEA